MKAYGSGCIDPHFLDLGTSWRSTSRPGRFMPRERVTGTHWIGGWVGLRAGLDDLEKRKFLTLPGLELRPLGRPAIRRINPLCGQNTELASYARSNYWASKGQY
jgi:hypothetical protein